MSSFPESEVDILIAFFEEPTSHSLLDYAHAATTVLNHVLDEVGRKSRAEMFDPKTPKVTGPIVAPTDDECCARLKDLVTLHAAHKGKKAAVEAASTAAAGPSFGQIFTVIVAILQKLAPFFS